MKKIIALTLILSANNAIADLTGAGDAAILAELVAHGKQFAEQLSEVRESVDISRRLEEYEQIKTVKKVYGEGRALRELLQETRNIENEIDRFRNDPFGTNRTEREVNWLRDAIRDVRDNPNAVKAYASIAIELNNLRFLGKAQERSQERIAKGTNAEEESQITATNTMIMSRILIENAQRQQRKDKNNTNVITDVLRGTSYSSIVTEE